MKHSQLFFLGIFCFTFTSCYSIKQGYYQIRLLMNQEPLSSAIKTNKNNRNRLEKLELVEPILKYVQEEIGLTPKDSYQKYIQLNQPYVSWVVQAANKHSLTLKTWWFPFVGTQPYLGFFKKEDALHKKEVLAAQNFDVSMGGVTAFSLLGYFPDPLYSSMVDGLTIPYFIETLIHENVHRTIYIKNNYSFNENFANFIARKATVNFLVKHPEIKINVEDYVAQYRREQKMQKKFQQFLVKTKRELDQFYNEVSNNPGYNNEELFIKARENKFNQISKDYLVFMEGDEKNTPYEFAFSKGKFNNAVLLSYAVYEEDQKPLEDIFISSHSNLKKMIERFKNCLRSCSDEEENFREFFEKNIKR